MRCGARPCLGSLTVVHQSRLRCPYLSEVRRGRSLIAVCMTVGDWPPSQASMVMAYAAYLLPHIPVPPLVLPNPFATGSGIWPKTYCFFDKYALPVAKEASYVTNHVGALGRSTDRFRSPPTFSAERNIPRIVLNDDPLDCQTATCTTASFGFERTCPP